MENYQIKSIKSREILDSRGDPTVEVELETPSGIFFGSAPSGASRGKEEAVEIRDGGKRYFGKGVKTAVRNINEKISNLLKGQDVFQQEEIDKLMINLDGTKDKSLLGANTMCAVSMAVSRAGASLKRMPLYQYIREHIFLKGNKNSLSLPQPCFNIVNGGVHAGNDLDFQEFMIVPQEKSFSENLRIASEIYHQLKEILSLKYGNLSTNVGDEGGFAPPLSSPDETIELILKSSQKLNYEKKIKLILDVAASQFFKDGKYKTRFGIFTRDGLMRYYQNLISKYPILGLEDPFAQDDWQGFEEMIKEFGNKILIIGDDLTVTNPERIKLAYKKNACNALIMKINQIGTVTETVRAGLLAKDFGWEIIVSHRSGETCDDFIADLAVGIEADFIKAGAPARGERVAKYNQLLRIEEGLK